MSSALRSVVVFAFVSAFAVLAFPGCSQQGEGERCDSGENGDLDCDSGLTCVRQNELIENITDRCCPAEGTETDKRCTRGVPTAATGGSSSAGTSSGGTSSGGASSAGTSSGGTGATSAEAGAGGDVSTAGVGGDPSTAGVGGDASTAGAGGAG